MRTVLTSCAFAALSLLASGAHAYTTYFGEDVNGSSSVPLSAVPMAQAAQTAFLANLTGASVQDFESLATGAAAPLNLAFAGFGGTTLSAQLSGGGGRVATTPAGEANAGRYSVPSASSTNYWEVAAGNAAGTFTVDFGTELAAFGFFGVDIGDFGGTLFIDLFDDTNTLIKTVQVPNSLGSDFDGSVLYFGLVAANDNELFKSIQFRSVGGTSATDVFAFDNFTIAEKAQLGGGGGGTPPPTPSPAPEPASLALVAAALMSLAWTRRRA